MNLPSIDTKRGGRNTSLTNINLPTVQPGQTLPLSPNNAPQTPAPAPAPQPFATQNATPQNVLQTAQNRAIGQANSPVQQLVSQRAQEVLNPQTPFNEQEFIQTAIDKANREQAQAFEQARQATGGVSNVGMNDKALGQLALQGRQQIADLKRTVPIEARNAAFADMAQRIELGNKTAANESAIRAQDIANLVAVRGAAEGDLERDFKMTTLLAEQDFQKEITGTQQAHQLAMQNNDITAARETLKQQLAFEEAQSKLGRQFTAEQNMLNRALQENLAALDINGQRELMTLKSKLDGDQFVMESEFTAQQNDLDRQLQEAMFNGETERQVQLLNLKSELDEVAASEQRKHETIMFNAEAALQKDMQLSEQEYGAAQKLLDRKLQESLQTNDIAGQRSLAKLQSDLELERMTAGLSNQEKAMRLEDELATARADGDVERQRQIFRYQTDERLREMVSQYGQDRAMAELNTELETALRNNDTENALYLQEKQNNFVREEAVKERALEEMRIKLQERGVDMAAVEQQYNMITAEVAAGRANPDSAVKYLQAQISKAYPDGDYVLEAPDPLAAQKALQEQFLQEQFQFALRNPGTGVYDANGVFTGLKDEHKAEFVRGQNEALYGIKGTPDEEKLARVRARGNFEELGLTKETMYDNPVYKVLLASPETVTFTPTVRVAGKKPSMKTYVLNNLTGIGGFMNFGGTLYRLDKATTNNKLGKDATRYDLTDPVTGKRISIMANESNEIWVDKGDGRNINIYGKDPKVIRDVFRSV
jgi:hypothetical protein